jgi:hypothetical protein
MTAPDRVHQRWAAQTRNSCCGATRAMCSSGRRIPLVISTPPLSKGAQGVALTQAARSRWTLAASLRHAGVAGQRARRQPAKTGLRPGHRQRHRRRCADYFAGTGPDAAAWRWRQPALRLWVLWPK